MRNAKSSCADIGNAGSLLEAAASIQSCALKKDLAVRAEDSLAGCKRIPVEKFPLGIALIIFLAILTAVILFWERFMKNTSAPLPQ